jgi:hypothetical protein
LFLYKIHEKNMQASYQLPPWNLQIYYLHPWYKHCMGPSLKILRRPNSTCNESSSLPFHAKHLVLREWNDVKRECFNGGQVLGGEWKVKKSKILVLSKWKYAYEKSKIIGLVEHVLTINGFANWSCQMIEKKIDFDFIMCLPLINYVLFLC